MDDMIIAQPNGTIHCMPSTTYKVGDSVVLYSTEYRRWWQYWLPRSWEVMRSYVVASTSP